MHAIYKTATLYAMKMKAALRCRCFGLNLDLGSQKGAALVEFALVLPMFLVLSTGIFTFGFALNNYLELTNAVTIGAQDVAVSRNVSTIPDPCAAGSSAIAGAAPYLTPANVSYTFTFTPAAGGVGTSYTGTGTSASCTAQASTMQQGGTVQVTATYPCTLVIYGNNFGCALKAQVAEIIQ